MVQGTMNTPGDASASKARLPAFLIGVIVVVCTVPFVLSLLGADFATHGRVWEAPRVAPRGAAIQDDMLHHILKGSFTHTILEWSAFCTAIFTVFLAFVHFNVTRDITTLVIGVALFFAGTMDALHTLVADRLFEAVEDIDNFIPFTWAICRLFNACMMIGGAGLCLATRGRRWRGSPGIAVLVSIVFGGTAYLIVQYSAASTRLPHMMFPEAIVTRPYDAVPLVLFLLAGAFVYPRLYQRVPSVFSHALIISTLPNVATQLHMAFGSSALFDAHFNMAHLLKTLSYLVPLSGLALDYIHTYREEQEAVQRLTEAQANLVERSEDLKRVNADLIRQNTELDEFNYVASHDLQEPLRKLISFSEHLRNDLGPDLPERAAQDLDFIVDGATRMQALIRALLALSRAGRTAMAYEWVNLEATVDHVLEMLDMRLLETHATIVRDPLPTVWGDPTLLSQVYQNLIDNALKFTRESPPKLHLTVERQAHHWTLGVRDHGIGLKPEFVEHIFLPFKRLHSRAEYPGTGIGLAICRKAIERHGGRIWVESPSDAGVHFKFTLDTAPRVTTKGRA